MDLSGIKLMKFFRQITCFVIYFDMKQILAKTYVITTQKKDLSGIKLMKLIRQITRFVQYFDTKRILAKICVIPTQGFVRNQFNETH